MVSEQSLVQMLQAIVVAVKDLRKQQNAQQEQQLAKQADIKAFQEKVLETLESIKTDHQHIKEEQAALKRLIQNTREMTEKAAEDVQNLDNKTAFITEVLTELSKTLLEEDNDVTERFNQHLTNVESVINTAIKKEMTDNYVMPIQNLANKTSDLSQSVQQVHNDQTALSTQMQQLQTTVDENSTVIATTGARVDSLANIKAVQETSQFNVDTTQSIDEQLEFYDKQLAELTNES